MTAQWQTWLRHGREETPSLEELVQDVERRERVRRLAKIADEKWKSLGSGSTAGEKLSIGSSEEALRGMSSRFVVCGSVNSSGSDGWDGRHAAGDSKRRTAGGSRSRGDEARVTRSGSRVDVSTARMVRTNRETDII